MSPVRPRSAPTPRTVLHRLGRLPNPLDWPPLDRTGAGRFDDPLRRFRVLYAARQRTACFAETLAGFRPSLELLAETGDPADITGEVSAGFLRSRGIATFHLSRGRWLDLRQVDTLEALRTAFGPTLLEFGLLDVDLVVSVVHSARSHNPSPRGRTTTAIRASSTRVASEPLSRRGHCSTQRGLNR